ncbi:MAG: ComEA family DNA-binding protein [Candidatus Dojkabacteria bacterium]
MKAKLKKIFNVFFYLILLTILVILIIGVVLTIRENSDSEGNLVFIEKEPDQNYIFKNIAYISGQINSPGVYEVEDNSRISDLISQAKGLTDKADLDYLAKNINLSEKIKDEQHIYIPSLDEREVAGTNTSSTAKQIDGKININTASAAELDTLPGIGPSTADKIIAARPFESIDDLLNVTGIGDSKFNEIKDLIDVK